MSQNVEKADEQDLEVPVSNDFQKIHEKAKKLGYADGIVAGSDSVHQLGFDKGYADGLSTGFELEKYRAFFETISKTSNPPAELKQEANVYENMSIPETTKSEHFQFVKNQNESIEDISKKQKTYVEHMQQQFEHKLPKTQNLFLLKN